MKVNLGMFTLVLFGCAPILLLGSDLQTGYRDSLVVGAVHNDALFVVPLNRRFTRATFSKRDLLSVDFVGSGGSNTDFPPRWKIDNNELIFNDTLPWFTQFRARRCRTGAVSLSGIGKVEPQFNKETHSYSYPIAALLDGAWVESDTPVDAIYSSMCDYINEKYEIGNDRFPFQHYEFFFDILPSKRKFDMIVLADGPLQLEMEQARKDAIGKPLPDGYDKPFPIHPKSIDSKRDLKPMLVFWEHNDKKQWVLTEKIEKPSFNERFWAYKIGTSYFFLTDSGKLYLARKPKEGDRKLEPIWDDKTKPIVGVITDTATNKVFLFGRNDKPAEKEAKGFYFELDEKPTALSFDPKKANAAKGDILLTAAEYARFLHAEKKVKIPSLDK